MHCPRLHIGDGDSNEPDKILHLENCVDQYVLVTGEKCTITTSMSIVAINGMHFYQIMRVRKF